MNKKISVTVEFDKQEFLDLLKDADWKIDDVAKFNMHIQSAEFAQSLAEDLLTAWNDSNEQSDDIEDVVDKLFGGAGCSSALEFDSFDDLENEQDDNLWDERDER